jgi:AcrR family transcriptional regulator
VEEVRAMAQAAEPARREPLTRARILQAAVRVMDADGLEAVTMRRLGRELGVEAMSLYNHVPGKEDLLSGMLETVLGEFELPRGDGDWLERLRDLAIAYRRLLLAHPNALSLFAEHRHLDPDCLRPIELTLEALRSGGLSVEETITAYHMLVGYVQGHVTLEIAGLLAGDEGPEHAAQHEAFMRTLPPDRFPRMAEMLPHLKVCDHEAEFEFGLDMLLAGLDAKLGHRLAGHPARP